MTIRIFPAEVVGGRRMFIPKGNTIKARRGKTAPTSTSSDTTPSPFTFVDVNGAALSTVVESNAITVAGTDAAAPISVTGGSYQINGGAWVTGAGTVVPGASVKVRASSSASNATAVNVTLTIGGISDTFTITTAAGASDTTPDAFAFTDVSGVALSSEQTSNQITVAGLSAGTTAPISVTGGTYSKNGGAYVSTAGTVVNDDTVRVRHNASALNSTPVNTTLTIGGVADTFTSTTVATVAMGVFYDSDMESDHDDLASFGVLYGLQLTGECIIRSFITTSRVPASTPSAKGLLRYSKLNSVPVGRVLSAPGTGSGSSWAQTVANICGEYGRVYTEYTDQSIIQRRALADAPNSNNVMIVVGGVDSLYALMQTPADYGGDGIMQTGMQLLASKVQRIALMQGSYPSINYEYNTARNATAAKWVAENSTVPLYYVGKDQSGSIYCGPSTDPAHARAAEGINDPLKNPYRAGFNVASESMVNGKRNAFDPMTVLYAIRVTSPDVTWLRGTNAIGSDPANPSGNSWTLSPTGNHYALTKNITDAAFGTKLDELIDSAYIAPYSLPAPANVVASNVVSTQCTLAHDEVVEHCGYEYRVNGGAWVQLPVTKLVTGLSPGVANTVELAALRPGLRGAVSSIQVNTQAQPELLQSGDGSATTGWTASAGTLASVAGEIEHTSTTTSGYMHQTFATQAGKTYVVKASKRQGTSVNAGIIRIGTAANGSTMKAQNMTVGDSSYEFTFVASGTVAVISIGYVFNAAGQKVYWDNLSVKQL